MNIMWKNVRCSMFDYGQNLSLKEKNIYISLRIRRKCVLQKFGERFE